MKIKISKLTLACAAMLSLAAPAQAQTISLWNFNSNPADGSTSTGTTSPSAGSGTLSLIGGVTSTFAAGSPGDPAPSADNSGLNLTSWAAQGTGSGTAGLQVAVSTVGFSNITISLDFRQSGTVSRDFQLQASSDGTTFNNVSGGTASFGTVNSPNTGTSFTGAGFYSDNSGSGSQSFVQSISYAFAPGSIYENDANFAFRWVAVFDPGTGAGINYISSNAGTTAAYSTSGTGRFDMVGVSSAPVPEPATAALIGLGGLAVIWNFRKRNQHC